MRNLLLATTAIASLALGTAFAQQSPQPQPKAPAAPESKLQGQEMQPSASANDGQQTGAAAGGATGAIAGAVVGGPIGAVIGGFAGAMLGQAASVPEPAVQYVVANPVEQVVIEGGVSAGAILPETVVLNEIPDHPEYRYVYADGRPIVVRAETREIVYSPGFIVPEQTVTYVESNPLDPVTIEGEIVAGTVISPDVQIVDIPDSPAYSYVYTDRGPVVVNRSSRTVVWVR